MMIVVDKCYLQSAKAAEIQDLKTRYRFVLPDAFFLELLTDENEGHRAAVVRKLGVQENPGGRIHIPHLLSFEIEHKQPAFPIEQFLREDFHFNPDLAKPTFQFLKEDQENMARWETMNSVGIEGFQKLTSALPLWFPELTDFPPGGPVAVIEDAMTRVGSDPNTVLSIIDRFNSSMLPPTELLDGRWAIFRKIKLDLLASLEFIRRYGAKNTQVTSQRLHNDFLDLDYLIVAAMIGAFATHDKIPRKYFRLVCPGGVLIPD